MDAVGIAIDYYYRHEDRFQTAEWATAGAAAILAADTPEAQMSAFLALGRTGIREALGMALEEALEARDRA